MKRKIEGYHRAKSMSKDIKELITKSAIETDTKREALADSLLEIIKKDFKNEVPPSRDTIIKLISKARNTEHSFLDEPWHLGLLGKFHDQGIPDFNADAVYAILKVQYWCRSQAAENYRKSSLGKKSQIKNGLTMLYPVLSIRQAKWVAVLHRFVEDDLSWLWMASFQYSYQEIISDISKTDFDASLLDNALYSGKRTFLFYMRQHSIIDKYNFGDKYNRALSLMQNATKKENARQWDARDKAIKHLRATGGKVRMLIDKDGNPIDKIVQLTLSPEELQEGETK